MMRAESRSVNLFALTIFLSAFLLFQIQPLIGKIILPWFGSTSGVWTTCLLFFQILLLIGYTYTHIGVNKLSFKKHAYLHILLIGLTLLFLPVIPAESWKFSSGSNPVWRILLLLGITVGGPYFLISTTAPLLQVWFVRLNPNRSPYRLYAVSNGGSLLALVSYPLLIEPVLPLRLQAWGWSGMYVLLIVLLVAIARRLLKHENIVIPGVAGVTQSPTLENQDPQEKSDRPGVMQIVLWLTLSALGSVILYATLNRLTMDVAAVPFLFVLPLSLYLITFVIAFYSPKLYYRPVFIGLFILAIRGGFLEVARDVDLSLFARIGLLSLALFAGCMACHGELTRIKPNVKYLTLFYMTISFGGVIGGLAVTLLAPAVLNGYWEYEIGLLLTFCVIMAIVWENLFELLKKQSHNVRLWLLSLTSVAACVVLGIVITGELTDRLDSDDLTMVRSRNFYGILTVYEEEIDSIYLHKYKLLHGNIMHGFQYRHPDKRAQPTSYYGEQSGVGLALRLHPARNLSEGQFRIGVLGLGTGSIGVYVNPVEQEPEATDERSDYLRYYEINPQVVDLVDRWFSYSSDAEARGGKVDVVIGDGRIMLENELRNKNPQAFDILAIDAFSSDSIPMHLLTRECFDIYFAHLKEDGILAVQVTNRYVDLIPVVRTLGEDAGRRVVLVSASGDSYGLNSSDWMLISNNEAFFEEAELLQAVRELSDQEMRIVRWTDDFSSLLSVLD